jgi:Holliday junction resolvase RusA-like endonuclease
MIEFEVLGVPAPQGSKTRMPNGAMIEGSSTTGRAKHKSWRAAVSAAARDIAADLPGPLDGALVLEVEFRMPMPASRPKRLKVARIGWHTTKPDLSKILRSTEDALTDAGLIRDDARICTATLSKVEVIGWTGAVIRVGPANDYRPIARPQ